MTLYVVATPIGNLADLSERAREVLGAVDVVACEDTRRTRPLLTHLGLTTPLISLHQHNESTRSRQLLERLQQGEEVALVSDAGTPLISDPGYPLVHAARAAGVDVVPVPGPSSVIAALSVAGLATDRFWFEGFLPTSGRRKARVEHVAGLDVTAVLLEAPHRLRQTLSDLLAACGPDREICIARELTKRFEQVTTGTLQDQLEAVESGTMPERGEIVLVLAGQASQPQSAVDARSLLLALLDDVSPTVAARIAAKVTGANRREMYALAQTLRKK